MTDPSLRPMAVDYCAYHHNHYPHPAAGMLAPLDLLQWTKITHLTLQNMQVWGCPHYVLEPTFQDVTEKNPKALNRVTKCHTMIVQDSFLGSLLVVPVEL